ncbi:MAG: winged helix-turn-helix domain-containing protein [Candidatus Pacearchaeota archaeon]
MNKKRDSMEIIHDILKYIGECRGKAKPTNILYKSNLSHQMLTEYLNDLLLKGLIKEIKQDDKKLYELTPKGYSFLNDYNIIRKFMTSYGFE